ncbi:hypothetical protein CVT24_011525 [Panaeolus cyanescens]|uniref:Protection of telomeres protein 1 n=1 Tax=Panaeolus cyanescens TaxID=181874 RepID=A0A409VML4_9AGAR|nr:hypothetical protein CVT24_011525 [Panaeolus cyanescens]
MKRPATSSMPQAKRIKVTPYVPRLTRIPTQNVQELCDSKHVDESKCVVGRVKMWWPATQASKNKARAIVELIDGTITRKVQLKLASENEEHLKSLTIRLDDRFRLSLRGAQIGILKQIPKLCTHPYVLEFANGFNIEWTHVSSDGTEDSFGVSCWPDEEEEEEEDNSGHVLSDGWYTEDEADDGQKDAQTNQKRQQEPSTMRRKSPEMKQSDVSTPEPPANLSEQVPDNPKFQAGCRTPMAVYPPLSSVRQGQKVSLIGIVVEASEPSLTRTGEWMRFLHIIDPSNYSADWEAFSSIGFKVNIFSKKHKEWLPHPRIGDAVLLRAVKIQQYQDRITGTIMASGLSWAAFSPDSGKIHHGPPSSAPKFDRLADSNHGANVTPYYNPGVEEVTYCVQLSDWWREVRPKNFVVAEQRSVRGPELPAIGIKRVHRLIQDAHPEVPPNGYFDCTVEVLRGISSHNPQIYTVYVTDYTENDGLRPVGQDWCPQELSQAVLQLEAWDMASSIARTMQPGQYYSIKNVRMKVAQSGYLEAKVVQNKITQLKGEMADKNPHLQQLLERKNKRMSAVQTSTEIPDRTVGDVEEGEPFNGTVELLHVVEESGKVCLFVTDYTDMSCLVGTGAGEPWAEGLQGKIMKIYLTDQQANGGRMLVVGSFYRINNERLIHKLSPNITSNEFLNGVVRRKARWSAMTKQDIASQAPKPKTSKKSDSPAAPPPKVLTPYTLIKDISPTNDKPGNYRLYAQVVDFHPSLLKEAFYQICAQCRKE